jgi:hypothetical protein
MKMSDAFDKPKEKHHIARAEHYAGLAIAAAKEGNYEEVERCKNKVIQHLHDAKNCANRKRTSESSPEPIAELITEK